MTRISILYPNTPGARFDFDYYLGAHMPLSITRLSAHPGYRGVSVERGLVSAAPDEPVPYIAMCHYNFSSAEDFMAAFQPHAQLLQGDMANYTDIAPVIQINEVLISR